MKKIIITILVIIAIILMVGIAGQSDSDEYLEANLRNDGKVSKSIIMD